MHLATLLVLAAMAAASPLRVLNSDSTSPSSTSTTRKPAPSTTIYIESYPREIIWRVANATISGGLTGHDVRMWGNAYDEGEFINARFVTGGAFLPTSGKKGPAYCFADSIIRQCGECEVDDSHVAGHGATEWSGGRGVARCVVGDKWNSGLYVPGE
jgi:hypothetical protein